MNKMTHNDGKEERVLKPRTFYVAQSISKYEQDAYESDPDWKTDVRRRAANAMSNSLLEEASEYEVVVRDDIVEHQWRVHVILPGDYDGMWFVNALREAREEGRAEGIHDAAQVARDNARRYFHAEPSVCSRVLCDNAQQIASDIEGRIRPPKLNQKRNPYRDT